MRCPSSRTSSACGCKALLHAAVVVLVACGGKPASNGTAPVVVAADAVVVDSSVVDAAIDPGPPVPTKPAALQAWLVAGHYKVWPHESRRHESTGPHPEEVLTFVSPALHGTLSSGGPHAPGAAAVKELYKQGAHTGWAVSVKVDADSNEGRGWYWYEVFSTKPGAKPAYEGLGKELCRDCHTESGIDQVLIPFPLQ
jgi:hypothetical protein